VLETLIAAVMLASLILYALMGGADYGGGMWDLLASGPRAERQRHAIVEAIAPIWEANHVWLILVIVLLFSGFPRAFSVTMIALHIPITAMLIGIVLRGSAFVFRKYDSSEDAVQRRWSTIFGITGPGPISAPGHTGCHYSKRRCTRVDLKAFAAGPRRRHGHPAAITLLPLSNFQRSRTALTPSRPSRSKPPTEPAHAHTY
jgi:Cytochrome bd terminal oxidase subunit II